MKTIDRRHLMGSGIAGVGVVLLSACAPSPTGPTPSPTPRESMADVRLAQLLSVLDQTLFAAYSSVNSAILSNSLVASDATEQLVQLCQAHHNDHIAQWTAALTIAPAAPLRMNDPQLANQLSAVRTVKTELAAITALMALETVAMETYAQRTGEITDTNFRHLAASIGPVEAQHLTAFTLLSRHQILLPESPTAAGGQARPVSDIPNA